MHKQITRLTVSLHSLGISNFEIQLTLGQFKTSFDKHLKLHQVGWPIREPRCQITALQTLPDKTKIESILARLSRLEVEGDTAGNDDERERRKFLFEYAFSIRYW
jgi:hypothetical protein